jgi:signal peptidase II
MRAMTRCTLVALVLTGYVACDQTSKSVARQYLPNTGVHSYFGDTFRFEYAQNPGAFLSLGDSLPPAVRYDGLVIGVGAFVILLLAWAVVSTRLASWQRIAIAAVGAAGASNLIDRIRFEGAVTDFLNLGIGPLRTGIFNIADVILTLGLVLLVLGWNRPAPARKV